LKLFIFFIFYFFEVVSVTVRGPVTTDTNGQLKVNVGRIEKSRWYSSELGRGAEAVESKGSRKGLFEALSKVADSFDDILGRIPWMK